MNQQLLNPAFFNADMLLNFNLSYGLKFYGMSARINECRPYKLYKKKAADLYYIKSSHQFFNLTDDGILYKRDDLICIFIRNQTSLILLLQKDVVIYHLLTAEEVFDFLRTFEICWVMADENTLIQPKAIKHIEVDSNFCFEVCLTNNLKLKFLNLCVPSKYLAMLPKYRIPKANNCGFTPSETYKFNRIL